MHRFFADEMQGDTLLITDSVDVHHVTKVLRLRPEEKVELVYEGRLFLGQLASAGKTAVFDKLIEQATSPLTHHITLIQGYPKGSKINEILMHNTECGVDRFLIAQMDRSVGEADPKKLSRYERIVKDAAKQSKRLTIPEIDVVHFRDIDFSQFERVYFFFEDSHEPLQVDQADESIALIIGPEGGFSQTEIDWLRKLPNLMEATLGPRIYRTETAGLVACAIVRDRLESK